jgi:hypothetical protein
MPWPPRIGWSNNKEITFVGVYIGKIGLDDSGDWCGPGSLVGLIFISVQDISEIFGTNYSEYKKHINWYNKKAIIIS